MRSTVEIPASPESAAGSVSLPRPAALTPATLETVIERRSSWWIDFHELWRYRELLVILAWRDIKVRYKQTVLGVAWAVLQPLAMVVVFSLFFNRLGEASMPDVPYSVFVFAGVLPWFLFANTVSSASNSVVGNGALVTKVYFPRLMIPLSSAGPYLIDSLIAFTMLLAMMAIYGVGFGWGLLLAPVFFLALTVAALGVGVLLAALTVTYRDFRYVVPFLVQLWMFATPAVYMEAGAAIGPRGQALLPLNPAHGLILNFRAAVLGVPFDFYALTVSSAVALAFLAAGSLYFRRVERGFADVI